jgi:hypothetical protein
MGERMKITRIAIALLLGLSIISPALARTITVPSGTYIYASANSTVTSKSAYQGETFSFTVHPPYPKNDSGFSGARLSARVVQTRKAGQGTKPELSFVIDRITLSNGSSSIIYANLISVEENKKSNVGTVALTALGGMIAGNIIGKWLGTNIGGAVGLTAGVLYGVNSKTDVTIPANAEAKFQLTRTLTVTR